MSGPIVIEAHRKRFNVKATPMQPLSAVVADVLGQLRLEGLAPEQCQLLLRGKPLDLATPVRFANIGRDKLELVTGREPVLGVHAEPAAPPAAAPPQPAPAPSPQQPQQQQPQQQPAPAPAAQPSAPAAAQAPEPPAAAASAAAAGPSAPAAAAPPPAEDSHPSVALFGRRVWVFTRQAEQVADGGASAGAAGEELPDAFFEFTEADLRRAMASQAAQRAQQEGGHLKTAAMRQREEQRRAESFGAVPIRLYLPGGEHCLQTALPATQPLAAVLALARAALAPQLAPAAYLFTTPPRTVVKEADLERSLYAAKLVPAAKVHVALDASKAPAGADTTTAAACIRPEVLALVEAPPQRAAVMHTNKAAQPAPEAAPGAAGASTSAAAGSAAGAAARAGGAGGKGVPKWLKLGK